MITIAPSSRSNDTAVNTSGTPPAFFTGWTCESGDQLPNLYKGVLDMRDVAAVQSPSQAQRFTTLDVIERELADCEFVSAHAAAWYQRPENLGAFREVCPSGCLIFLEKYRVSGRGFWVVYLYVHAGKVHHNTFYAGADAVFDANNRFAVRRKITA